MPEDRTITDDDGATMRDDVLVRVSSNILALMKAGDVEPVVILGVRDLGDGTHEMTAKRPDVDAEKGRLREAVHAAIGYISADIEQDDDGNAYRLCQQLREVLA